MKVSELRVEINHFSNGDDALSELSEVLERFDSMSLDEFFTFLKSKKIPANSKRTRSRGVSAGTAASIEEAILRLSSLKVDANAFEAELDKIGKPRSFTKKKLQRLYSSIFETKSYLPDTLSKTEMIDRIKRQRRRDANFASA